MKLLASFAALTLCASTALAGYDGPLVENLLLQHQIAPEGDLPPIEERVPEDPLVVDLESRGREPGLHGGTIRMFVSRSKDVRYMAVWGYARLVGYDENYDLVPDLLKDYQVSDDGRTVTLTLRKGHRWSNGDPFTTEDLRYWWEDVALNADLSPSGPPVELLADGQFPEVTVINEQIIQFSWPVPNPKFLPALAQARPLYIYRPAKYMKRFHKKYISAEDLAKLEESGKTWKKIHNKKDNLYKFDNPKLPVLQPWVNTTKKNNQRYVLVRNPYFHRIDSQGRQLPYAEEVELEIAASGLIPLKASRGQATLQIRSLGFSDAPVLKQMEKEEGMDYVTHLWESGYANEVAIYPNLNYSDEVWRDVMRDVRLRRALSLGISRKAINKVLYFGLATPAAVSALEESPFYDEENASAWTEFDLDRANGLLDEMGLTERNPAGLRLLPDGRPMEVVIETAGERAEVADTLEIVAATWEKLGLRLLVKPQDRDVMRNRAYAGKAMMVAWYGWNVGIPTAASAPNELAPVDQATYTWPKWGQHYQTKGSAGEAPDLPEATRLLELFTAWVDASGDAEKSKVWEEMLSIHADQVFAIGTISRAPLPLVHHTKLKNVPKKGIYAWDPGGQLGIHRMDEFFFEGGVYR